MKDCICQVRLTLRVFFLPILVFSGEWINSVHTFLSPHAGRRQRSVPSRECRTRNSLEELYPSDYHERRVKDKVSTRGSSLKDRVKMLCRNSHWSDDSFNKKSFLTEHQTQQTEPMFLFRLKMDRRSKTVQHERIKQKTVLVLISPLQETGLSCGHHAMQESKVKCLCKRVTILL